MIKFALIAPVAAFAVFGGSPAQAQYYTNYPYCAYYSFRTVSCAFNTWQQCMATVSGRGGSCRYNVGYQPPANAPARRKARTG
jgi:hypothetical protein